MDGQPIPGLPSLDLDNLEILNDSGDQVSLASNDDPTTYPSWFLGDAPDPTGQIHNATPCVVIIVEKNAVELDAFYFYFYSWNEGPNITQVIEPLNRILNVGKVATGMHFGDHVGDWSVARSLANYLHYVADDIALGSITWFAFVMENPWASITASMLMVRPTNGTTLSSLNLMDE